MKRQSPVCSMKLWIAHGPASPATRGWSSSPSFQKHSAERKAKRSEVRKWKTTGSARWPCAQASTVFVVPKSRPSARRPAAMPASPLPDSLDARELVLLSQLLLDVADRLLHLRAGHEQLLELVVVDVLLPRLGLAQRLEAAFPIPRGVVRLLRRGDHAADLARGRDVEAGFAQRRNVGIARQAFFRELREHAQLSGAHLLARLLRLDHHDVDVAAE